MLNGNRISMRAVLKQVAFVLVTLGLLSLLALQTPAPAAAQSQRLAPDSLLNPDGTLNLSQEASGTLDLRGWNVTLDPQRGPVLSRANESPSSLPVWSGLDKQGLDSAVYAMAVYGNALYVGGSFTKTFDNSLTLNHIAMYDGTGWSALPGNGLDNDVWALTVMDDSAASSGQVLYVGGAFTQTFDGTTNTNLKRIAKFDGSDWAALPNNGLSDLVDAFAVVGSKLYVGGSFTASADMTVPNLYHIAKFDPAANSGLGTWSALDKHGLNSYVDALVAWGSDLYAGGEFTQTADSSLSMYYIAKYDTTANSGVGAWSALDKGGLSSEVHALAVMGNSLYAGGQFGQTADGNTTLAHIARYDGSHWHALPNNGLKKSVGDPNIFGLYAYGNALYVAGNFTETFDTSVTNLNNIAKFDGTSWSALPNNGLDYEAVAITSWGNALYVGGAFTQSNDTNVTDLNEIAKLTFAPTQTGPTFTVNTNADTDDGLCDTLGTGNGNQDCTLREAIHAANAQGGANTIQFDTDHTVSLSSALPTLTTDTTIDGSGHAVVLDGGNTYRILSASGNALQVNHLTFQNGYTDTALSYGKSGGAINSAGGTLTVSDSIFIHNIADSNSGAILANGTVNIVNSTFTNNSGGCCGGAVYNTGTVNVANSTFNGNSADYGGAIDVAGTTTISNSTFASNTAAVDGGAVQADGPLTILNSTFSDNSAQNGGVVTANNTLTLKNSVLANSTGADCSLGGTLVSGQNNLIESTGGAACGLVNGTNGNLIGIDPQLGTFGIHGGSTWTISISATSPAVDAGDDGTCRVAPVNGEDQRRFTRPFGTHCDMGAFEKTTADCLGSESPEKPTLLKPANHKSMSKAKVAFDWTDAVCATTYKLTVKNTTTHVNVKKTVTASQAKLPLGHGSYKWFVQACNGDELCTKSATFKFTN